MVISDYDIGKEVGRGAGGVVYQGTFKDGTPIAVKKIDVTALDKEDEQLVDLHTCTKELDDELLLCIGVARDTIPIQYGA